MNARVDPHCFCEQIHPYSLLLSIPRTFKEEGEVISQSFNVGRVKFLLTDLRSQKRRPLFNGDCSNPRSSNCKKVKQGSNFGTEEHLRWFKNQLLDAKNNRIIEKISLDNKSFGLSEYASLYA